MSDKDKIFDYDYKRVVTLPKDGYSIGFVHGKQEAGKGILQEILGFIGANQKFCIVDEEHKTLINADKLFDFIGKLAKKYGIEVDND